MKNSIFLLLIFSSMISFGQTNYYTFNKDSIMTEDAVRTGYNLITKNLPAGLTTIPTIYHQMSKGDSIINYIIFVRRKAETPSGNQFRFEFKQDSIFLLLDNKLPDFNLKDIHGKEFDSKQLKGKPTLINYWSTSCKPCIEEIPKLNELKEKYGKEMNFIAISPACEANRLNIFLNKNPFTFLQLVERDYSKNKLKNNAMPRNLFIDKDGYVRYIQGNYPMDKNPKTGEITSSKTNYFTKIIEELIKKQ